MSTYTLRLYEADDETVAAEFSTDPAHARPWLHAPTEFAEAEIDLARGAATIGQVNVRLIDPQTGATQQDRGLSALLANVDGYSAWIGHRAELLNGTGTVLDGVVGDVALSDSFAGFSFSLRDIRERERRCKAFTSAAVRTAGVLTDGPTVFPRGRLAAYGALPGGGHLLPAVTPSAAEFAISAESGVAYFTFPDLNAKNVPAERVWTEKMRAAAGGALHGSAATLSLLWRAPAGAWNEWPAFAPLPITRPGTFLHGERGTLEVEYLSQFYLTTRHLSPAPPMPANGATVELVVVYTGEPTKDYPFRWEGTAGELLRRLYDGDLS
jgi:hypothetical protein